MEDKNFENGGYVNIDNDEYRRILETNKGYFIPKEDVDKIIEITKSLKDLDFSKFNYEFSNMNNINSYDVCSKCPNHSSNGGSGVCNCTLPYMNGAYKIT